MALKQNLLGVEYKKPKPDFFLGLKPCTFQADVILMCLNFTLSHLLKIQNNGFPWEMH